MGIYTKNAFVVDDPYRGVDNATRRALGQVNVDTENLDRLRAACDVLKLKHESPVWKPNTWAHIGLPALKVAIYSREILESEKISKARAAWSGHGWKMMAITTRQIGRMTDEQIIGSLRDALRQLGKLK